MATFSTETKIDLGIIRSVNKISNEVVSYVIKLETYHQENQRATGIPIFSFGYNSYTYELELYPFTYLEKSAFVNGAST